MFVGVDGGGTKTAAAVVDLDGRVVGQARVGSSAFKSVGLAAAAGVLASAVEAVLLEDSGAAAPAPPRRSHPPAHPLAGPGRSPGPAGAPPPDPGRERAVIAVLAAVSDVDTAADRDAVRGALAGALARAGVHVERLDVCNDSVAALASGTNGLARGIACIAGTGSVCLGLDGLRGEARAGGWGPPFGDGGSGYWIGFRAISRALELHDSGRRESALIRELLAHAGCATLPELLFGHVGASSEAENAAVYRARVAALAQAVDRAAAAGDADAREVFAGAGRELAKLVSTAAGRLRLGDEPFDLVRVGGVWKTRVRELHDAFAEGLRGLPGVRLREPRVEPAVGAALLARELARSGQPCPGGLID